MDENEKRREDVHSLAIRAGRRTYFFDVKETRKGDYFLTITESKKVYEEEGDFKFKKHKIFLYKEDFEKFTEAYDESINFIKENQPDLSTDETNVEAGVENSQKLEDPEEKEQDENDSSETEDLK